MDDCVVDQHDNNSFKEVDYGKQQVDVSKRDRSPLASLRSAQLQGVEDATRFEIGSDQTEMLAVCRKQALSERNKNFLINQGIEYVIFRPTQTGLRKSILDAVHAIRVYFKLASFHDYGMQLKGADHRVYKKACLVSCDRVVDSRMSLYRPETKDGDPRMWFRGLPDFAAPEDEIAIIVFGDEAYLFNLSCDDLAVSLDGNDNIGFYLSQYLQCKGAVAQELLAKLKVLAKKPIPALGKGDTAIGMAIEAALGIPANSSKKPDYKGIELKSGRGSKNRTSVFAQVANWSKSECKSSREIVERYGYDRNGDQKLYCTVSAKKPNSQGLYFESCNEADELYEKHKDGAFVATWEGEVLRGRLLEKHGETFWIKARSEIVDGHEYFHLQEVTHTRSPMLSQLMPLLENGVMTMDHLIKKKHGSGQVTEKGPLFKLDKQNLHLLFPQPITYLLA